MKGRCRIHGWVVPVVALWLLSGAAEAETAPWHLDRIDDDQGLDGQYGVSVKPRARPVLYVIDSGINGNHAEFASQRVVNGYSFVDSSWDSTDCAGHGTHVAALAVGKTVGVANSIPVDVVSVKLLDCDGRASCSSMIKAMEWVYKNHTMERFHTPAVVVMSVGSNQHECRSVGYVAKALSEENILVVAAGGNSGVDACNVHPASSEYTVAVGATDFDSALQKDLPWAKTNYGSCIDLHAPGVHLRSAWIASSTSYKYLTGTSMSAPLVAGQALLIRAAQPDLSANVVRSIILSSATQFAVDDADGNVGPLSDGNRLVYVPWRPMRRSLITYDGRSNVTTTSNADGDVVSFNLETAVRTEPPMQYVADDLAQRTVQGIESHTANVSSQLQAQCYLSSSSTDGSIDSRSSRALSGPSGARTRVMSALSALSGTWIGGSEHGAVSASGQRLPSYSVRRRSSKRHGVVDGYEGRSGGGADGTSGTAGYEDGTTSILMHCEVLTDGGTGRRVAAIVRALYEDEPQLMQMRSSTQAHDPIDSRNDSLTAAPSSSVVVTVENQTVKLASDVAVADSDSAGGDESSGSRATVIAATVGSILAVALLGALGIGVWMYRRGAARAGSGAAEAPAAAA